jgi:hypothetical protein
VRASWPSDEELLLDLNTVSDINHFLVRIAPRNNDVQLTIDEVTGELHALSVLGRGVTAGATPASR